MTEARPTSEPIVFEDRFSVRATRDETWRALTEVEALETWFAQEVAVDLRPEGHFRFGGKSIPTFGGPPSGDQVLTAVEPGAQISFRWTWCGVRTRCTLRLEDEGEGTAIQVRHEFEANILDHDGDITRCLARDFWFLATANLDEYVRTGQPALLPDHSQPGDVELSLEIEAAAATVWNTITDPDEVARWLAMDAMPGPGPTIQLRVGGRYSFGWEKDGKPMGPQEILELEPGRRLLYSWCHEGDATDRTEWLVEPLGEKRCRLTVRQLGTESLRESNGYGNGWATFLLVIRRSIQRP